MDAGIAHHYAASGKRDVFACIASPDAAAAWRRSIEACLADLEPEVRWWRGLDVGLSSAAIFAVFCAPLLEGVASEYSRGAVPHDNDDFGRCSRLLTLFPRWRKNLDLVAAAYPTTKWPALVAEWDSLEAATPKERSRRLAAIAAA